MNGLLCVVYDHTKISVSFDRNEVSSYKHYYVSDGFVLLSNVLEKFKEDCIFENNDSYAIASDGVVLNSNLVRLESCEGYNSESLYKALNKDCFNHYISLLRGSFSGLVYDRAEKQLKAYTDHFATKTVFYSLFDEGIIIASELKEIVKTRKKLGLAVSLDEIGAYSLMTYGYMFENHTLVKDVYKLLPGSILSYLNGSLSVEQYHVFDFTDIDVNYNDAIEEIDSLFRNAVTLQYEKNKSNGYLNVVPLSAGMDCRMTSFVLKDLTHEPSLNITYSETNGYDHTIPALLSKELNNRWLFKNLDNGWDLLNIQESIAISDGLIKYDWPAQLLDFLALIDTNRWGIVHTGVLGDVILGTFDNSNKLHRQYSVGDGAFSKLLIDKLKDLLVTNDEMPSYDYEYGMLLNRGVNGACLGYSRPFRTVAEDLSPFMNVDFADYCFSLPLEYRRSHKIYYDWVKQKYPSASNYKHNGIGMKGKLKFKYNGHYYFILSIPDLIINKIKRDFRKKGYGMNPQQTWYDNNPAIRLMFDSFFQNNFALLDKESTIARDVKKLYESEKVIDKILAISFLGNYKFLFDE